MFFALSKVLDIFLDPLAWTFIFMMGAIWGGPGRSPRRARMFSVLAFVWLYVFSLDYVADHMFRKLERAVRDTYKPEIEYDAVIVLGGLVAGSTTTLNEPSYNDNIDRLLIAYDLLRLNKVRFAVLSGGFFGDLHDMSEAEILALQLERWGIDRSRLVLEKASRNTHENAVYSAKIAREQNWKSILLITSAFHMPRARGCFQQERLDVDTLSVDYRALPTSLEFGSLLPRVNNLSSSGAAIREYFGHIIYRWRSYAI